MNLRLVAHVLIQETFTRNILHRYRQDQLWNSTTNAPLARDERAATI